MIHKHTRAITFNKFTCEIDFLRFFTFKTYKIAKLETRNENTNIWPVCPKTTSSIWIRSYKCTIPKLVVYYIMKTPTFSSLTSHQLTTELELVWAVWSVEFNYRGQSSQRFLRRGISIFAAVLWSMCLLLLYQDRLCCDTLKTTTMLVNPLLIRIICL